MQKSLNDVLKEHGITLLPTLGKTREGPQYLFYSEEIFEGKTVATAHFGDFKTGIEGSWRGGDTLTPDEEKVLDKKHAATQKIINAEKLTHQKEVAVEARVFWDECHEQGTTPYMERKGLRKLYGSRIHLNDQGTAIIIVPLRDVEGTLWSYQRIFPLKFSAGDKFLLKGGRKEGCFHLLSTSGEVNPESTVYITEGWATGVSVFEALGCTQTVVVAIDAGNLLPVGLALKEKYPDLELIYAADNDAHKQVNRGLEAARAAASKTEGKVVYPRFPTTVTEKLKDFNDLAAACGLPAVREQIEHPERFRAEGEIEPIYSKGKPPEDKIAFSILSHFKDRLIRQEQDLFLYRGTHWELMETAGIVGLRNMIRSCAPYKLTSRDVDSAFKTLKDRVPHVPPGVNLFTPTPFIVNFRNGSLHLYKNSDSSYRTEFKSHNEHDFITYVLPFDYLPESEERNEEFEAMLGRIWVDEPDLKERILHYGETLGSCLMSAFAGITIYVGKPGTGKSTLLLIASKLIAEQNLCGVDPTAFDGFNMESMPGKLVNIVTDLNTQKPISDELVKMITDRVKFKVRRKGLKDIYAFIPAVHLWACNKLPKSFEGESKALVRRVTIVDTNKFQPTGLYDKEYHAWVWEKSPQGIINFAVSGLHRLIANRGHYTVPESSRAHARTWTHESDVVGLFFDEMTKGEILVGNDTLILENGLKMERPKLWETFVQWHSAERGYTPKVSRIKFFARVKELGIGVKIVHGVRYFDGLGLRVVQEMPG